MASRKKVSRKKKKPCRSGTRYIERRVPKSFDAPLPAHEPCKRAFCAHPGC